jgi:hypothetical protein
MNKSMTCLFDRHPCDCCQGSKTPLECDFGAVGEDGSIIKNIEIINKANNINEELLNSVSRFLFDNSGMVAKVSVYLANSSLFFTCVDGRKYVLRLSRLK